MGVLVAPDAVQVRLDDSAVVEPEVHPHIVPLLLREAIVACLWEAQVNLGALLNGRAELAAQVLHSGVASRRCCR